VSLYRSFFFVHRLVIVCLYAGILVEGLGSLLDGVMGTGNGTTSTSINVGVVGLTKVCATDIQRFVAFSVT